MKYRETLVAMLVLVAVYGAIAHCTGCVLPGDATSNAELEYRAALLRCVDKAKTLPESKACRSQVDGEYLARDGGAQ